MIAILESQYLPQLRYFTKFQAYDVVHIDISEGFRKQTYRNRCHLASANGILPRMVPVQKEKTLLKTCEVLIDNSSNWQRVHWQSIRSSYGHAAFYEFYAENFQTCYEKKYDKLVDFNHELLIICLKSLKIPLTKLCIDANKDYLKYPDARNFRNTMHPKSRHELPDPNFHPVPYMQVFEDRFGFQPNLSILDLIMNEGPRAAEVLAACLK